MPSIYGPFSNGTISFQVGDNTSSWSEDPTTGNYVPGPSHTITLTYEVALTLSPSQNNNAPGAELVQYYCQGKLLSPTTLDPRITVGLVGTATLNGLEGRFILTDRGINTNPSYRPTLRQTLAGTFEHVGAGTPFN